MAVDMAKVQQHVSQEAARNISQWLKGPKYQEYRSEVEALIVAEEWQTLEDSFFKVVEFGTGGRRGTVGVGSNRINRVTIGESAQALCLYVADFDVDARSKGIVIAYDTRLSSPELSRVAAEVCAANGFRAYLFESFRSTPELSFAVRHLGAAAGIVISASHNPPADNGFKAYWSDGAQLVAPHDAGVLEKAAGIETIHTVDFDTAVAESQIQIIGDEVDAAYVAAASAEAVGEARDISIVYSPLHGAGQTNVLPVLRAAGFTDVREVEVQMVPDGNFPSIPDGKPNPQEVRANEMAVQKMLAEQADIAITNDPDADRIGVVVRQSDGEPIYINGNQAAALAADYVLETLRERGELTPRHYLAKTIVTTDLLQALADHHGVAIYGNMLVGFKYIGELLRNKESTDEIFLLGGEESYGLLKGTYARDKDGAAGALTLAEAAAQYKAEGKTLYDRLLEMFAEHGIYEELLVDVQFPGADGFEAMQSIMRSLQSTPPAELGGKVVTATQDYTRLKRTDFGTGQETDIDCTSGNVLVFEFGDVRRRVTIRPSGTEPKLKLYVQWHQALTPERSDVAAAYADLQAELTVFTNNLKSQLLDA